jgi:glycerate 2-kinase
MKILVAPDSFKGSLSAFEAAEAMRRGVLRARPQARVDVCPLADGGEGTASVLLRALGGQMQSSRVTGPLGRPVEALWALLADGRTAVIETAQAAGLTLVPDEDRDPSRTTTYGVGELIRAALDAKVQSIIVGLGGSATVDGGAGMAQALGVDFAGATRPVTGGQLGRVYAVDTTRRDPRLSGVDIRGACDVGAPLTGSDGAAPVYGPQKGATEFQVRELDAGLRHLAALLGDPGGHPGDGAAGGLGYGLRVFAGARIVSGIDLVLDAVRFDARLDRCDWVLTGEGRLDGQSARGKVVSGVSRRCRARGVPVVALAGSIGADSDELRELGLSAWFSICEGPITEREAKQHAAQLLEALAEKAMLQ